MNPLRRLVQRLVAWNHKPRYRSAREVVGLLRDVERNSARPEKLDGFISVPIINPKLERIREEFGIMYGPGFDPVAPQFVALISQAEKIAASDCNGSATMSSG